MCDSANNKYNKKIVMVSALFLGYTRVTLQYDFIFLIENWIELLTLNSINMVVQEETFFNNIKEYIK